jgi:hypothetical protein
MISDRVKSFIRFSFYYIDGKTVEMVAEKNYFLVIE